jgi:aspartate kinase
MLSVLKVGGSVLRDDASYAATARFMTGRLAERADERLVVIVSAQYGTTDELLAEAEAILADAREGRPPSRDALRRDSLRLEASRAAAGPAIAREATMHAEAGGGEREGALPSEVNKDALDLLWSTGELRSVARLTLHLQRLGVSAVPFNVHQTGLVADRPAGTTVRPLRLLAALATSRIVIVPGFLGVSAGGTITSLGRGGSDLTAVLLAIAVRANACELIKDVPGYFTADPHHDANARPIHDLTIDEALSMADGGCDLVQRAALTAAAHAGLHLVIRSMDGRAPVTHVHASIDRKNRSKQHGVRHQDDSRRAAVGA